MLQIHSVRPHSADATHARTLFTHYGDFLKTIESAHSFDFPRFAEEIATLPAPYTDRNGELLLASLSQAPVACIAFRHAAPEPLTTCEIKRLFVLPTHRGQGIARALIAEALTHAHARHYTRAILDTDLASMPAAYATYLTLGFTEYAPPGTHPPSLRFLELELT